MDKDNGSIEAAIEGNTANEASESNKFEIPCRLRVVDVLKSNELKDLSPDMDIPMETRKNWTEDIQKAFSTGSDGLQSIRPWDILLHLDGPATTVKYRVPDPIIEDNVVEKVYPVRYQLPFNVLEKLPAMERVLRTERFALGCLIYEIQTQNKPYADLDDDVVRKLYNEGKFPSNDSSFLQKTGEYIRAHPIAFGLQVAGGAVAATSLLGLPILGALGFTAIGPAAGSVAAAWQASLGLAEAGSLFAFCQVCLMFYSFKCPIAYPC